MFSIPFSFSTTQSLRATLRCLKDTSTLLVSSEKHLSPIKDLVVEFGWSRVSEYGPETIKFWHQAATEILSSSTSNPRMEHPIPLDEKCLRRPKHYNALTRRSGKFPEMSARGRIQGYSIFAPSGMVDGERQMMMRREKAWTRDVSDI